MAAVIARFLPLSAGERASLSRFVEPSLRNWKGLRSGRSG